MPVHLPIQEDVQDLLAGVVGRGVSVDKAARLRLDVKAPLVVAVYVTDDDQPAAVVLDDPGLACRAGGALMMVPPAVVKETAQKNEVPENLLENYREVINIFARSLNSMSTPHVRFSTVHTLPGPFPDELVAAVKASSSRRDLVVAIDGYGEGKLSIVVL